MTSTASPQFKIGDEVCLRSRRDQIGVVVSAPKQINSRWYYDVNIYGQRQSCPETDLEPGQREQDPIRLLEGNYWGGYNEFSRILTYTKLDQPLRDHLYSFRATRTRFEAYQFKPLVKFLESPRQRLLIADEVGLGKTIEAGYIIRELQARHPGTFRRVLVVCPAALRQKWRDEMQRRFEESFEILDANGVRSTLIDRAEREGDRCSFFAISSMQTLRGQRSAFVDDNQYQADWESNGERRPSLLDELEAGCPSLDLVIVDEAHHLRNVGTLTHRLGQVLSAKADAMIMLTATPIQLGEQDLFRLLGILDPQEFSFYQTFRERIDANQAVVQAERCLRAGNWDGCIEQLQMVAEDRWSGRHLNQGLLKETLEKLRSAERSNSDLRAELQYDLAQLNLLAHVVTRTRKRDVLTNRAQRTAHVIRPEWTVHESAFYEAVTQFCCEAYSKHRGQMAAQFVVINLQRQMASCIPALLARIDDTDFGTDEDIDVPGIDDVEDDAHYRLNQDPEFRRLVKEFRADLETVDSKFDALLKQLSELERIEPGRKLVIFSFFKQTLIYLERRLREADVRCELISGDVPSTPQDPARDERGRRVTRFINDPSVRVLLSSEVGSEGLDFHQNCHILVNYDLPWNPMRVEQRIGRLDRFGQKAPRVLIYNFAIPNSIEDRILARLYNRIRVFEDTIGDLEPILGQELKHIQDAVMRTDLSWDEKEQLVEQRLQVVANRRLEQQRLEEGSAQFIGGDDYFLDQIRTIDTRRRFLAADEMERFIGEFLREVGCSWRPSPRSRVFELKWSTTLRRILTDLLGPVERQDLDWFALDLGEPLMVTCDGDIAYEQTDVELLSVHHPLLIAIRRHYDKVRESLKPVSALQVSTTIAPPGDYLYAIYCLDQEGAFRPGRYLEPLFLSADGLQLLKPEVSEDLLYEMTLRGSTLDPWPVLDAQTVHSLHNQILVELDHRLQQRRASLERLSNVHADRQIASLNATFEAKKFQLEVRLEAGRAKGAQPRYMRMIEGSLRRLETSHQDRVRGIDGGRLVTIRHQLFAAGVVSVTHEQQPI